MVMAGGGLEGAGSGGVIIQHLISASSLPLPQVWKFLFYTES